MSLLNTNKDTGNCPVRELIEREVWLMSEAAGEDLSRSALGICQINQRIADLVGHCFTDWLASITHDLNQN